MNVRPDHHRPRLPQRTPAICHLEPVERALKNTRDSMPFLIALTPAERRLMKRVGEKELVLVELSLSAALENPAILPAGAGSGSIPRDRRGSQSKRARPRGIGHTKRGIGRDPTGSAQKAWDRPRSHGIGHRKRGIGRDPTG